MALSAEKAAAQNEDIKTGSNFYDWKEKNYFRFLPLYGDEESWCVPFAKHFLRVSEDKVLSLYCTVYAPFHEKECMVHNIIKAGKDFLSKDDMQELKENKKGLALAIDIKEPKLGVQLVKVPISMVSALNGYAQNGYDFADLDEGAGVVISKKGSGLSTEYSLAPYKQGVSLPVDELMDRDEVEAAMEELDPEAFIQKDNAEALAEFAKEAINWRPELKPAVPKAYLMGAVGDDGGDDGEALDAEFDELPPCYGKEWEEGDDDCEECPSEDDCKKAFKKRKAKKKKPKAKGKPKVKAKGKPARAKSKLRGLM